MQNLLKLVKISSLAFLLLVSVVGHAQKFDLKADLAFADSVAKQELPASSQRVYIYKNRPKTLKYYNPVNLLYGGSLYVYQNYFSQHLSATCLYNPSCSDFSKQAVKKFGIVKGTLLSFDRLSRCNRIAATDLHLKEIDPKTHRFHDPVKSYK